MGPEPHPGKSQVLKGSIEISIMSLMEKLELPPEKFKYMYLDPFCKLS